MQTSKSLDAVLAVLFLGAVILSLTYLSYLFALLATLFAVVSFLLALSGFRSSRWYLKALSGLTIFLALLLLFVLFMPIKK